MLRSLHGAYLSLHPSGVVHWVPEQLNIKAVTGACKLIDGCSLELCSATPSVACHWNQVSSIAWLYRDGLAMRTYQLHSHFFHIHYFENGAKLRRLPHIRFLHTSRNTHSASRPRNSMSIFHSLSFPSSKSSALQPRTRSKESIVPVLNVLLLENGVHLRSGRGTLQFLTVEHLCLQLFDWLLKHSKISLETHCTQIITRSLIAWIQL